MEVCGQSVTSGTVMSRDGRPSHWHTWVSYGSRCVLSMTTRSEQRWLAFPVGSHYPDGGAR